MVKIVVLAPLPQEVAQGMFAAAAGSDDVFIETYAGDPGPGLVDAVRGAGVIIGDFTFRIPIDATVAEAARGCMLIQQPSIGYQHIDLEATRLAGIPVANVGAANAIGVAEQAIMFMLCLLKRALYFHDKTAAGEWAQQEIFTLGLSELHGKTLGIIGMGNIGREVAKRAKAFGCRIVYSDTVALPAELEEELEAERLDLEELLPAADIATLHVPLTPETTRLIDRERLAMMKPDAHLLNLARGEVVDEAALAEALGEGRLAGAGIDVFTREPVDPYNPLLASDKVILSPHVSGGTNESRVRMLTITMENVNRVLSGEKPLYVVNGVR
ncbi:MAG: 2-hydroxyacid dehydrogenase [Actinomycetota bacterium]|nr:2-hydroxyacid dehydrogenase [Actinomycetota bacterium]MDD5666787.1 2-hydroxyacid dehydrogenase [Actinomycetota bacterium]